MAAASSANGVTTLKIAFDATDSSTEWSNTTGLVVRLTDTSGEHRDFTGDKISVAEGEISVTIPAGFDGRYLVSVLAPGFTAAIEEETVTINTKITAPVIIAADLGEVNGLDLGDLIITLTGISGASAEAISAWQKDPSLTIVLQASDSTGVVVTGAGAKTIEIANSKINTAKANELSVKAADLEAGLDGYFVVTVKTDIHTIATHNGTETTTLVELDTELSAPVLGTVAVENGNVKITFTADNRDWRNAAKIHLYEDANVSGDGMSSKLAKVNNDGKLVKSGDDDAYAIATPVVFTVGQDGVTTDEGMIIIPTANFPIVSNAADDKFHFRISVPTYSDVDSTVTSGKHIENTLNFQNSPKLQTATVAADGKLTITTNATNAALLAWAGGDNALTLVINDGTANIVGNSSTALLTVNSGVTFVNGSIVIGGDVIPALSADKTYTITIDNFVATTKNVNNRYKPATIKATGLAVATPAPVLDGAAGKTTLAVDTNLLTINYPTGGPVNAEWNAGLENAKITLGGVELEVASVSVETATAPAITIENVDVLSAFNADDDQQNLLVIEVEGFRTVSQVVTLTVSGNVAP